MINRLLAVLKVMALIAGVLLALLVGGFLGLGIFVVGVWVATAHQ